MASNVEIVIGTYEEFLLGYKLDIKNEKSILTQTFADKSHSGAIKCMAIHNKWIATGSVDDRIFIYDMRTRKQSQIILSHDGTVNALAFTPDNTHLLSGGDDGKMIATRLNTWFTEATWKKAHSGAAVTHISCHPSGKLALSLGGDLVLRTWNLVKGRVAYKTNLKSRNTLHSMPDCLAWSTDGDYFTLTGQRIVEIWSIKTADVVKSVKTTAKPICIAWVDNETCLVGLEDGNITWADVDDADDELSTVEGHKDRVKAMCFYNGNLATVSSAGEIKLWEVDSSNKKLEEIASTNIGCRPTCIGLLDIAQFGSDYKCINAKVETKIDFIKPQKVSKTPQRGVVTIEYENDVENENDEDEVEDANEEEEEEEEEKEDDEEEVEESEDETEESSSDKDEEPQIRLPKSRKRKQQILNQQSTKAKTAKFHKKQMKLNKK